MEGKQIQLEIHYVRGAEITKISVLAVFKDRHIRFELRLLSELST